MLLSCGRWTAFTGSCSPCKKLPGAERLAIELGDDLDWLVRYNETLAIGEHYALLAELGDDGQPDVGVYIAKEGIACDDCTGLG